MAGTITHAYFALDVYDKLDDKTKRSLKKYKENLKTYGQGHDIFFFCTNFTKQKNIGSYFHKNNTKNFFINIIKYIYNNNLQNDYEIISYLYGYICHYSLDLIVHPYVTYKCGIFKKGKKETYKYNAKHSDMESYIDAYMINKREKIEPNKFKIHKFCFNTKVSTKLSNMIDYVYKETYNLKHISFYYKQGIFNMKKLYGLLRYDPHKIKKFVYSTFDKITGKGIKKMYPISLAYDLNNNDYYLNLNHNKWNHARCKEEVYTYSVTDLYNNALDLAVNIINSVNDVLYNSKNIQCLDKVFLNLSFSSGKECNDNTKNKYFEY